MHRNVAPDALPGSATFVSVLDPWLNDWIGPNALIGLKINLPRNYLSKNLDFPT